MTGLSTRSIMDTLTSHAAGLGIFETVSGHEVKNAPGLGLYCEVWADTVGPALSSGVNVTSAVIVFKVRVRTSMLAEPQDEIDPQVLDAVDILVGAYVGDFELGGDARAVDVRGMEGVRLGAKAGYLNQDNKIYRVMDVTVPVIVNDVWTETP